jgi:hypothetical protein
MGEYYERELKEMGWKGVNSLVLLMVGFGSGLV